MWYMYMNEYIDCSNVYIAKCKYGLGVFACSDFVEGEVIEYGLMTIISCVDGNINPHLFTWSDDRKVWACGSGCLPFYNNNSVNPNVKKQGDLKYNTMQIIALRDIKKGEELMNTYLSGKWRACFKNQLK